MTRSGCGIFLRTPRPERAGFAAPDAPVLDFAHGCQKEDQKESDEVEEIRRQKDDAQEKTGEEEETFQEVGGEKACSKKSDSEKEDHREEEDQREGSGRSQEKDRTEKTRRGLCGILTRATAITFRRTIGRFAGLVPPRECGFPEC